MTALPLGRRLPFLGQSRPQRPTFFPPPWEPGRDVAMVCRTVHDPASRERAARTGEGATTSETGQVGIGYLLSGPTEFMTAAQTLMLGAARRGIGVREVYGDDPVRARRPGCSAVMDALHGACRAGGDRPVLVVPALAVLEWPGWGQGPQAARALRDVLGVHVEDLSGRGGLPSPRRP